ncbi:hypothetical protein DPMN_024121 [Dreissena polymorpha]|uniref:Uncharacterized protein n=1 Tax=Dreissena polymorpha TaxID=45954 RepID=A0A9D4RAI8_DREPO|nr:hypothetical protein DPMN_024121 [Dreissena polymorpha]
MSDDLNRIKKLQGRLHRIPMGETTLTSQIVEGIKMAAKEAVSLLSRKPSPTEMSTPPMVRIMGLG